MNHVFQPEHADKGKDSYGLHPADPYWFCL